MVELTAGCHTVSHLINISNVLHMLVLIMYLSLVDKCYV